MFIINGTSPNRETKCFVYDSPTIARVIGDKLESQRFEVEILDQLGEEIQHFPADPYRRLSGLQIDLLQ
jgi:hypothetical protein